MKKYQEIWLAEFQTANWNNDTKAMTQVLAEITEDDTGGTDSLSMELADVLLRELLKVN